MATEEKSGTDIIYGEAAKEDYAELIRLRLRNMDEDYGGVSDHERECMEKQLPDYFDRALGRDLIVFTAKDKGRIVSTAYLLIRDGPSSIFILNGLSGEVRGVYTLPEYRGQGIATQIMRNLVAYGRKRKLSKIQLESTEQGHSVYHNVGFADAEQTFVPMEIKF